MRVYYPYDLYVQSTRYVELSLLRPKRQALELGCRAVYLEKRVDQMISAGNGFVFLGASHVD
jgi:hypothetical protein